MAGQSANCGPQCGPLYAVGPLDQRGRRTRDRESDTVSGTTSELLDAAVSHQSYKLILTPVGVISNSTEELLDWAKTLPRVLGDVSRLEFDAIDAEAQAVHNRAVGRPGATSGWIAIVSLWASASPPAPPAGFKMEAVRVVDRIGYGFEADRLGPVSGYKKFSFWTAKAGVSRQKWNELYAHHIKTVPALQPIWRYRQNIILEKPKSLPFEAISENWWMTLRDLSDRFYFSAAAKEAVHLETRQFIDFDQTFNFVSRNQVLVMP
jgi:hypothetical protein